MKKTIATTVPLFFLFIITLYFVFVLRDIFKKFDYAEIDFDNNGYVTFSDYLQAMNLDKRQIQINGKSCVEYYSLKDGETHSLKCF